MSSYDCCLLLQWVVAAVGQRCRSECVIRIFVADVAALAAGVGVNYDGVAGSRLLADAVESIVTVACVVAAAAG